MLNPSVNKHIKEKKDLYDQLMALSPLDIGTIIAFKQKKTEIDTVFHCFLEFKGIFYYQEILLSNTTIPLSSLEVSDGNKLDIFFNMNNVTLCSNIPKSIYKEYLKMMGKLGILV